jgi:hypothetical protein
MKKVIGSGVGSGAGSGSISQRYGSTPKCHGSPTLVQSIVSSLLVKREICRFPVTYLVVCVQLYVAVLALQDVPASLVARELGPLHQEIQALLLDKIFYLLD